MNIIFKIARTELRNLFYSPVAWFLAIVFLVQCAIFYSDSLTNLTNWQDLMVKNDPKFKELTRPLTKYIFLGQDGVFAIVLQNLYLFVPLLTMNVLSREINNGTIKLLYSSPIRLREIVLGKYLAIMVYNLLLLSIVGLFMISSALTIRSVDYGLLLSAALGFYLLVCAFSAIGLFMSSLSTYQVVSGIATFVIIFILGRIGTLWQKYDFVRDLTWFLAIAGRTEKMLRGLITSKDVIYFLLVICMFLGFTLIKLKSGRESKPWSAWAARYIAVVFSVLLIGYVSSRPALIGYWDTTACKTNTVQPRTQKIIKELDDKEPLEVTLYTNLLGRGHDQGFPESRNAYLTALWEPFVRFKPDIKFKYVYYYDNDGSRPEDRWMYNSFPNKTEKQMAGIMAQGAEVDSSMFIGPEEIRKMIDPNSENGRLFMQMKYKGRAVNLRTFDDQTFWPDESQIDDGLKRLMAPKPPKVYFLTGDLERSIQKTGEREYSMLSINKYNRFSLINHAFDMDTLSLEKQDLPVDMDLLVIADPKVIPRAATMNKVQQYISKGGNLIICGEPGKQYVLNPLLQQLGVQLRPGTLVELSKNETPDKVFPLMTGVGANLAEEPFLLSLKESIRTKENDTLKVPMPGVATLSYVANGAFNISPLLTTAKNKTWLKMGTLVLDSVPPVFNPVEGDIKQPTFPTAIQLTRQVNNKQQRIIVCGDADFTSNMRIGTNVFGNAFYSWLTYGKYPQYLPVVYRARDTLFTITGHTARMLKTLYVWVLPGLLLLGGIILLIRRKRK